MPDLPPELQSWFDQNKWSPFPFQKEVWQSYQSGKSGLLHAPTGFGKTLSVWLGPVLDTLSRTSEPEHCEVLWLTPLRALANDTLQSLKAPLTHLTGNFSVEARTGDSSNYQKQKLRKRFPYCLVTTPESLSLLFTHEDTREKLSQLKCVIVDEWHELLGTKRGVQTELCLTRLRHWFPDLRTWALSATLGDLKESTRPLMGTDDFAVVSADLEKKIEIKTLIPEEIERFPWSGHLGIRLLKQVSKRLNSARTTLVFTNTRSQSEIWFQELTRSKPRWAKEGLLALHHGSLDREERNRVEEGLKDGSLRVVVCTSSLDLGVDFSPVDQVIQIGSPKGIARMTQRAGRAGHRPGQTSRIYCVPTNALELIEFTAIRDAWERREIETRSPLSKPLDVLVQHLVTLIIGEPATPDDLKKEIFSSATYQNLTEEEWLWAIEFITNGGALSRYPQYQKAVYNEERKLTVENKKTILLHRMSIGTITATSAVPIKFASGKHLGSMDESFITRLKPGQHFTFAGKRLELLRFRNQAATVKVAKANGRGAIATWNGTKMPLSTELSHAVARRLLLPPDTPEMAAVSPILDLQRKWSALPGDRELLIEYTRTREGEHLFIYPFAGRLVHEGLGALAAFRLCRRFGEDITVSQNDYGFCLTSQGRIDLDEALIRDVLSTADLLPDLLECLNTAEMARRQFREIARVAGLIVPEMPGRRSATRDLQVSSNLLFEVFTRYDPDNLLLEQSRQEILERQLELTRLKTTLLALEERPCLLRETPSLTPMAFPLWADRLTAILPAGDANDRLERMLLKLQSKAPPPPEVNPSILT